MNRDTNHEWTDEDLDQMLKIFTEQTMAATAHCGIQAGETMEDWLRLCEICFKAMRLFDQRHPGRPGATWDSATASATARDKTH